MAITWLTRSSLLLCLPLVLATLGCTDPATGQARIDACVPVPGEVCDDDTGYTGDEETDGDTDDEPTELLSHECRFNDKPADPVIGIQYQCQGQLHTHLSFNALGQSCTELIDPGWCQQQNSFGVNFQPYAAAEVIACCGEYDSEFHDNYKLHCTYDMYQQLCGTLAKRMEAAIHDGVFGAFDNQAAEVQTWIVGHYEECFTSLLDNNSAALPDVISHWSLGDFGLLHDVVLHIDAPTRIDSVSLPADASEWLTCDSARDNNDQVFEDSHTPDGPITVAVGLLEGVGAELLGPSVFGDFVSASARFDATCEPRGCPRAVFSLDPASPQFTLEEFDLFEPDPVLITNGTLSLVADRAQMRLWTQAQGYEVLDPSSGQHLGYELPVGSAKFVISGLSVDGGSNRFMALNSTDIWISEANGVWSIQGFDVEFEDGTGELWTVMLDDSGWTR